MLASRAERLDDGASDGNRKAAIISYARFEK
jgi:hypothetical protein